MARLVIHAPFSKFKGTGETFEEMSSNGIARGYILSDKQWAKLTTGCDVILLDKEREKRAEGRLTELRKTDIADNGQQRYDVYFTPANPVAYKAEPLERWGTGVVEKS